MNLVEILPASLIGSYLIYIIFMFLNKSREYPNTYFVILWNYGVEFISHILMGVAFIGIGSAVAPRAKRICSCVLFALVCIFAGVSLFANFMVGFSWVSLLSTICMIGGAGYVFYLYLSEEIS